MLNKPYNLNKLKRTFYGSLRGFFVGVGIFILFTLMFGGNEFSGFFLEAFTIIGAVIGAFMGFFKEPNDPNKCDGCDLPFSAECLRKNLLGFRYCQNCYPALFKDDK